MGGSQRKTDNVLHEGGTHPLNAAQDTGWVLAPSAALFAIVRLLRCSFFRVVCCAELLFNLCCLFFLFGKKKLLFVFYRVVFRRFGKIVIFWIGIESCYFLLCFCRFDLKGCHSFSAVFFPVRHEKINPFSGVSFWFDTEKWFQSFILIFSFRVVSFFVQYGFSCLL